jgi:hypothetical protein
VHLEFIAQYWWAIILGMALLVGGFVVVAGWGTGGSFGQRSKAGWEKWRALSRRAGEVQARVILTVFYFTVAAPFGLARALLADPLRLRPTARTRGWLPRTTRDLTLDDAKRQF